MKAGKHVLLEKPFTSNASEARALVDLSHSNPNLTLLEAFHYRFHPSIHYVRSLLHHHPSTGRILSTRATMTTPTGTLPRGKNIRWSYDLAGGSFMDMTYVLSATRFLTGSSKPDLIVSANATKYPDDPRIDSAMTTEMRFKGPSGEEVKSEMYTDFERDWWAGLVPRLWDMPKVEIETEKKRIEFWNFMMPHLGHWIEVEDKVTGERETVRRYKPEEGKEEVEGTGRKGEAWWSTYRYM